MRALIEQLEEGRFSSMKGKRKDRRKATKIAHAFIQKALKKKLGNHFLISSEDDPEFEVTEIAFHDDGKGAEMEGWTLVAIEQDYVSSAKEARQLLDRMPVIKVGYVDFAIEKTKGVSTSGGYHWVEANFYLNGQLKVVR